MKRKRTVALRNLAAYQSPPAEKIGKYKILGTLGRGGMGIVYKGLDPDIEREVAIKTIRLDTVVEGAEKDELLARVVREAKAAGRLNHPNIITIYDVIHKGELTFIIMQYIDGHSLMNQIDSGTRLSPREVIDLLRPLADALDYAHQMGIVHRDIKPANILIDKTGKPVLADFGIARMEASTMTGPGKTIGTLSYMAPEQVMGGAVDHRADLFALGVILYELLTGKKPFGGDNMSTIVYKIVNEEPPRVTDLNHDLPKAYEDIIRKALAKNPDERYQSGMAMIADLETPENLAQATHAYDSETSEIRKERVRSRSRIVLAAGLILFAVLGGVGYKMLSSGRASAKPQAPAANAVKPKETPPPGPPQAPPEAPPAVSPAEENLAKLRASFEAGSFEQTIAIAQKILHDEPANAGAREFLNKARDAQLKERARPLIDDGIAKFRSEDFRGCAADMEEALKLDKSNPTATSYLRQAEQAISKAEILGMLEQYRIAVESKDWPTIESLVSPALAAEVKEQFVNWFNGYDGIRVRILDTSANMADDPSGAKLVFSQMIHAVGKQDHKQTMLDQGQSVWELKRVNGSWKVVNISKPSGE